MADLEDGIAATAKASVAPQQPAPYAPQRPVAPRPVPAQVALYVQAGNFIGELTAGGHRKELHSLGEIIKHSLEVLG